MSVSAETSAANNLRLRTLTALWLVPLVVGAVLGLPTAGLAVFFGVFMLIAAWEWCALAGVGDPVARTFYLILVVALLLLLWHWPALTWTPLLAASLVVWAFQIPHILRTRTIDPALGVQPALLLKGLLILSATWAAILSLHRLPTVGPALVISFLFLIAGADSAAYFVGRRWGRVKLAPAISPGKTWAGFYGALAGSALIGLGTNLWLGLPLVKAFIILLICLLAVMLSVIGDLYESLLKRRRHLKDSSQILPGHGGLLDRIDSLTAAAPLYALGMSWVLTDWS
ncbi:phosphatidate cytidylyltransferase [Caldichromatium japonicum]|uniref:Phosphatidate cytidylyltransferase n=1 Tax=Caldichromatium japonicum TaxID=2699430 RepID=A0A6G7VGN0_9GAMM|nr:phosphatidate cytidylyltransferase [Caldichromatium japonicum]QIK39102.1 phosphatidate cytidylyltransferase [Caldichromatium japonicum]